MRFVKTVNINFTDNLATFLITKSLWSYLKLLFISLLELGFGFDQSLPRGKPVGKSPYYRSFDRSANWRVKDSISWPDDLGRYRYCNTSPHVKKWGSKMQFLPPFLPHPVTLTTECVPGDMFLLQPWLKKHHQFRPWLNSQSLAKCDGGPGMMQFTMKQITVWNSHTQIMLSFSDHGWPRVLSFSDCFVKSTRVTGGLFIFGPFPPSLLLPFCKHFSTSRENPWSYFLQTTHGWPMGVGKFFGTHLGDHGSRSLSYRSGMQFALSPQ